MLLRASVQCSSAGKGFGESSSKDSRGSSKGGKRKQGLAGVNSSDSKAVQRAVKLVEKEEARQQRAPAARPVDPREAARGKVEYVKVKDWGSGKPEDLGSLQVDSEAKQVVVSDDDEAMPFHEALARRLEMLQTQGALSVAQPQGGKPLPPFERWAFTQQHYEQYLGDMYAVHAAVEESIAAAAAELDAAAATAPAAQRLLQAVLLFSAEQGLQRAQAVLLDLEHLTAAATDGQQQQQAAGSDQASSVQPPAPTQHAAAYAAYVSSLGRLCRAAEGAEELEQAVLRLLAHTYIVYLMHLTSGGRIAAAATAKLDLAARGALNLYSAYPEAVPKPLELFVANTNALGRLLSGEQREALMEELPKAMTKTSLLLVPLAREA